MFRQGEAKASNAEQDSNVYVKLKKNHGHIKKSKLDKIFNGFKELEAKFPNIFKDIFLVIFSHSPGLKIKDLSEDIRNLMDQYDLLSEDKSKLHDDAKSVFLAGMKIAEGSLLPKFTINKIILENPVELENDHKLEQVDKTIVSRP